MTSNCRQASPRAGSRSSSRRACWARPRHARATRRPAARSIRDARCRADARREQNAALADEGRAARGSAPPRTAAGSPRSARRRSARSSPTCSPTARRARPRGRRRDRGLGQVEGLLPRERRRELLAGDPAATGSSAGTTTRRDIGAAAAAPGSPRSEHRRHLRASSVRRVRRLRGQGVSIRAWTYEIKSADNRNATSGNTGLPRRRLLAEGARRRLTLQVSASSSRRSCARTRSRARRRSSPSSGLA
jgi:hypothetical protein